jgi:hypothetical protein
LAVLPAIVVQPLYFDNAALRDFPLSVPRLATRALLAAVKSEVRMTCALISKLTIADHLRAKASADIVE